MFSGEPINLFSAGEQSFASVTIAENILTPGGLYRFALKVTVGGIEGISSMDVQVRTGPTSGQFTSQSNNVTALESILLKGK